MTATDYSSPTRNCDVVMKGGITSGIVYPAVICRLAREHRFRSIGGASAGAIAAAATAAAEHGRRRGRGTSFFELETLHEVLGEERSPGSGSRLFRLFRPQRGTARLFDTVTAGLRRGGGASSVVGAALRGYAGSALLGAAPGLALGNLLGLRAEGALAALAIALPWLLLAGVGALAAVGFAVYRDVRVEVPRNLFGLATGMGDEALTPWLHALLQRLSGKPDDEPLTFGDLWGDDPTAKEVDLQMMTTCLTQGRAYRLPFAENEEKLFYFRVADVERLFPREVVDWLVAHARTEKGELARDEFLPLPLGKDLPVVVAARMSLSFPLLISAVPLGAIDFSRKDKRPEPCWFSDGGIASNFPVHFFDAPLPNWPTFAVNLRYFEESPEKRVMMPERNVDGIAETFHRFEEAGLLGFFKAVVETMQSWRDNTQARLPGFRDRIVHVALGPGEGGLNLDMKHETIAELARSGLEAGELLAARFGPGSEATLNWDNHRWVRFRSTMASLEEMLSKLGPRLFPDYEPPQPGDESYAALVERAVEDLPSYKWTSELQREAGIDACAWLRDLASRWLGAPSLSKGAPRPTPLLRARPRV